MKKKFNQVSGISADVEEVNEPHILRDISVVEGEHVMFKKELELVKDLTNLNADNFRVAVLKDSPVELREVTQPYFRASAVQQQLSLHKLVDDIDTAVSDSRLQSELVDSVSSSSSVTQSSDDLSNN